MFGLGIGEILLLLIFALIFIGPKKLPEVAKSLGKGLREFQKASQQVMSEINRPSSPEETEGKKEIAHEAEESKEKLS